MDNENGDQLERALKGADASSCPSTNFTNNITLYASRLGVHETSELEVDYFFGLKLTIITLSFEKRSVRICPEFSINNFISIWLILKVT